MRPLKNILIYHPKESSAALYRFALEITLHMHVRIAKTVGALSEGDPDTTVRWAPELIRVFSPNTKRYQLLPVSCSTAELVASIRQCVPKRRSA